MFSVNKNTRFAVIPGKTLITETLWMSLYVSVTKSVLAFKVGATTLGSI